MAFAENWFEADRRIERLASYVCAEPNWVKEMLFEHTWPNQDEHEEWLQNANDNKIVSWLLVLQQFGEGK